jgi:hypothetical protein
LINRVVMTGELLGAGSSSGDRFTLAKADGAGIIPGG